VDRETAVTGLLGNTEIVKRGREINRENEKDSEKGRERNT
jgi:hypothetical protein